MFNLSSRPFSYAALRTLNLGQKFIPTPGVDTPRDRLERMITRYTRNIRLRAWFGDTGSADLKFHVAGSNWEPPFVPAAVTRFNQDVTAALQAAYDLRHVLMHNHPVPDNVTPEMRRAMFELQHDPSVTVKPSDKNMGLCILDRSWYIAECLRQLGDTNTYAQVPAANIPPLVEHLRRQVLRLSTVHRLHMPDDVYKYLKAAAISDFTVPYFYLLPKVHKLPAVTREHLHLLKGRPIAACHSWVTNASSVYLADVLNHTCHHLFPQVLPDSRALVRLLERSTVGRDAFLVTFDVVSMYPSIDNNEAVTACAQAASQCGYHGGMVEELLTFVMQHGYCQFDGQYYKQVHGTVMGTPVAPPYSNIYVASCLEAVAQAQCEYWPAIYKRFIDDGFFVWEQDEASLQAFLQLLNSTLPNIKITWQYSQHSVDYMDLTVTKCAGTGPTVGVKVTTFQKPHNQYMYIPYFSFHRRGVFKGFITAELQRYAVTNTLPADFAHMQALFFQRLVDRGYPVGKLRQWFAAVEHSCRVQLLQRPPGHKRRAGVPPVLVLQNGQFEMTAHIAAVLNRVYAAHKHEPAVAKIFGGSDARLIVAYTKNRSLGARLIRARH